MPGSLSRLGQLEDHRQACGPASVALRPAVPVASRGEGGLDRVRRPQMLPELRREAMKAQQLFPAVPVPKVFGGLGVYRLIVLDEGVKGRLGLLPGRGAPDLLQAGLGLGVP